MNSATSTRMPRVLTEDPTDTGPKGKFDDRGIARPFPGNTILCPLEPLTQAEPMARVVSALRQHVPEGHIAWLPASSYHVTIFDCFVDSRRGPGDWPDWLPADITLDGCTQLIAQRLADFDLSCEPPLRLVVDARVTAPMWTAFPLRPVDAAELGRMRRLRDRLAEALGFRRPNHDAYQFHTSFGYYVQPLAPSERRAYAHHHLQAIRALGRVLPLIELGAPEFSTFETMLAYRLHLRLSARQSGPR